MAGTMGGGDWDEKPAVSRAFALGARALAGAIWTLLFAGGVINAALFGGIVKVLTMQGGWAPLASNAAWLASGVSMYAACAAGRNAAMAYVRRRLFDE